jgi:hypothetical protein
MATKASTTLPVDGWRTTRRCGPNGGNCVEVNRTPDMVGVRDTKPVAGPVLIFAPSGWSSFVSATTQGDLHA